MTERTDDRVPPRPEPASILMVNDKTGQVKRLSDTRQAAIEAWGSDLAEWKFYLQFQPPSYEVFKLMVGMNVAVRLLKVIGETDAETGTGKTPRGTDPAAEGPPDPDLQAG